MTQVICDKYYECEGCKWKYADKYDDIDEEYRHCTHLIEVAEVKHGKWVNDICTNCRVEKPIITAYRGVSDIVYQYQGELNYCPNCGAKMDGGEE